MIRKMASTSNAEDIIKSLRTVLENIQKAVERRPPNLPQINPRLVAVSKTKPVKDIVAAYSQGQRHFGENYVQELEEKASSPVILEQCKDIKWHLIGHLQRNKSVKVAALPNLHMIETIDSQKLAQTLNNHWEKFKRPGKLSLMVQVNTSSESNKSGCNPEDVADLVTFIKTKCPHLTFTGLMTIGALGHDPSTGPNQDFLRLVECREDLCNKLNLSKEEVELSMGMSSDYEHAIELGSSNIRVGSTIFGARDTKTTMNKATPPVAVNQLTDPPSTTVNQSENSTTNTSSQSTDSVTNNETVESDAKLIDNVSKVNINDDKPK